MRESLDADPFRQFARWLQEAIDAGVEEPTAMVLATCSASCRPSARVVLLKDAAPPGFTFYTSYEGQKAEELAGNPRAALAFWWPKLARQVRIEGTVEKVAREESERYFRTRPRGSRIGAWASSQSRVIESREVLEARVREMEARYPGEDVPLPPFWGGYRLRPDRFEFWQGRENRLHDRFAFLPEGAGWRIVRLSP